MKVKKKIIRKGFGKIDNKQKEDYWKEARTCPMCRHDTIDNPKPPETIEGIRGGICEIVERYHCPKCGCIWEAKRY